MENNANITVTAADGKKYQAEVIDIFKVNEYPEKEYILYSFGETVEDNNEKVYVSILEMNEGNYNLKEISDQNEWEVVQKAINEDSQSNEGE